MWTWKMELCKFWMKQSLKTLKQNFSGTSRIFLCWTRTSRTKRDDNCASNLGGPDLLQSLIGLIFNFRQTQKALTSDVEAMFHQVNVPPAECKYWDFCGKKTKLNLSLFMNMEDTFWELRVWQYVWTMLCNKSDETAEMTMGWSQSW